MAYQYHILWLAPLTNSSEFHLYYDIWRFSPVLARILSSQPPKSRPNGLHPQCHELAPQEASDARHCGRRSLDRRSFLAGGPRTALTKASTGRSASLGFGGAATTDAVRA